MALSTTPIQHRCKGQFRCHGALISSRRFHSTVLITADGEIDAANAAHLSSYTLDRMIGADHLIIDLSNLNFFAVQGISMLFTVRTHCAQRNVGWALVAGPAVSRVLTLAPTVGLPTAESVPAAVGLARAYRPRLPHCS
jgi:anti-anti-sigma factor